MAMTKAEGHFDRLVYGYRLALYAYPATFRQEYGVEMTLIFRDCCQTAWARQGMVGLLRLCGHTWVDLLLTAWRERLLAWCNKPYLARREEMVYPIINGEHRFVEELTQALNQAPIYYGLLLHQPSASKVGMVADSLALDGDPNDPDTLITLFSHSLEAASLQDVPQWLAHLCEAVRQQLSLDAETSPAHNFTTQLTRRIYNDPKLFALLAAEEVGAGLIGMLESLAFEGNTDEIEMMLALMEQLSLDADYRTGVPNRTHY